MNDLNKEASDYKRSFKKLPWIPSTQVTLVFHVTALVTLSFGIVLFVSWQYLVPDVVDFVQVKFAFTTRLIWVISAVLVILGIASLLLSVTFSHRIVGPMVAIKRHIDSLISGEYDKRVKLRKNDEFHDLAEKLNALAEELEKRARG